MTNFRLMRPLGLRRAVVALVLLSLAACVKPADVASRAAPMAEVPVQLDQARLSHAVEVAKTMRAAGQRVWCVPFARNASGIEIRGNAEEWYGNAPEFGYARGHRPMTGAVMAFSGGSGLTAGHVAVVSQVVSPREVLVDHANWKRNQVSLGMRIIDVSDAGDWSRVQVESNPGQFGRTYRLDGFIYPSRTGL